MTQIPEQNLTADDAHQRLLVARVASLVEPTEEYLLKLRAELYEWIEEVDVSIAAVAADQRAAARRSAELVDEERYDEHPDHGGPGRITTWA